MTQRKVNLHVERLEDRLTPAISPSLQSLANIVGSHVGNLPGLASHKPVHHSPVHHAHKPAHKTHLVGVQTNDGNQGGGGGGNTGGNTGGGSQLPDINELQQKLKELNEAIAEQRMGIDKVNEELSRTEKFTAIPFSRDLLKTVLKEDRERLKGLQAEANAVRLQINALVNAIKDLERSDPFSEPP